MTDFVAILVPALGYALLNFLWQGAMIGMLTALALHSLAHARPQARYAVACLALLACVVLPLVAVIAQLAATSFTPLSGGTIAPLSLFAASPHTPDMFGIKASAPQLDAFLPWIVGLWAAGTFVLSLRMAVGLIWIRRLSHSPHSPPQAAWQQRLDTLAVHFGLHRSVELRLVDSLDSPVSAGWWRPVVLLPTALLTRMPTDLIEALLAHELAHIRRHDYLINLLQNAVEALLFYHPVTWWLSNRIRIERELIADQVAAEGACTPRHLALALSELSELNRSRPIPQLAQAARGGQLLARIEQLLRPARNAHPSARIVFPLLGLVAACIASYSYAQVGKLDAKAITYATQVDHTREGSPRETIALVINGDSNVRIWGPNDDLPAIEAAKRGTDGDFLWIYRAGKDYVVTDPSSLARARKAWHQTEALSQQIEALNEQLQVHSSKMETLGRRMETLSAQQEPSPETSAAERAIEDMANQQLDAEAKHTEAQQLPMDALVRDMDLASEAMEALSKRMEVLGRQQEKAATYAERELRELIKEALAGNLAIPTTTRISVQ